MRQSRSAQACQAALVVARRNLEKAADAGVLVVMGTDSGPFSERFQGCFEHLALEMMVEYREPIADIRNTRSVPGVWIAGNRVPS